MYEAFYGFKEKPFSMLPDPGFLFLSKKHQTALTLLEYGLLNHVGFCVISGEPGAGKTTILRALLERVPGDVTVGLITNTHQSFGGLLDWILSAFDLHRPDLTQVEMHQIFMDYLIEEYANNRTVLLIVDEAQNMKSDTLEELRMLSNVNTEKDQLMQVVLAGQPALRDTLRKPELMQFAQRIAVDFHLEPLGVKETCGYIQHRLVTAGAERNIFTPAACERIHCYSGGTPRLINLLCETSLVYGFADQREMVDVDLVDEVVQERMKNSVVPIVNRDAAEKDNKEASQALEKDFPWIKSRSVRQGLSAKTETSVDKPQKIEHDARPDTIIADEKKTKPSDAATVASENKNPSISREKVRPNVVEPSPQKVPQKTDAGLASSANANKKGGTGKKFVKYGVLAGIIALVLLVLVLLLSGKIDINKMINAFASKRPVSIDVTSKKAEINRLLELQEQHKQEEARIKQLQMEAETLKKERDAAIAKIEEEKRVKQQAEKLAAEKAALAVKAEEKKSRLEEKKRLAAAQERQRLAKKKAAKARAEAERVKREAAKRAEEKRLMEARIEENRRKEQQEARRLEREWLEQQRQQLFLKEQAAAKTKLEAESRSSECSGTLARFKAGCR